MIRPIFPTPIFFKKQGGGVLGGVRYPRSFPFSAVVPRLSLELYRMVLLCFLYGLQLQLPAMEATLLKVSVTYPILSCP